MRYIHVAWGLIVLDGSVLLRHREDKNRPNANNYVLIGGRISQNDLRQAGEKDPLVMLQSPSGSNNSAAISIALEREINEETGLVKGEHYNCAPWRKIKPYRAVEGAGANHALTEYRIHVFHIELTQDGMLALSKRCRLDKHLAWFTQHELMQAKTQFTYRVEDNAGKKTSLIVSRPAITTSYIQANQTQYAKDLTGVFKTGLNDLIQGLPIGVELKDVDTFKKISND